MGDMQGVCHRCQAELPGAAGGLVQHSDDLVLFCPRCGAPQLLLQEHMRIDEPPGQATTGTLPPPRVGGKGTRSIDWRRALLAGGAVAFVGAVLVLVGLNVNVVAFLAFCWLLGGAVISVLLYSRQKPRIRIDARVGLRIGFVTGVLMVGALGVGGAATGVVLRFGTHGLDAFDRQSAEQNRLGQAWAVHWMEAHNEDKEVQEKYVSFVNSPLMTSPEMKAGAQLAQLAFQGLLLLLVASGGGAFAGMLQRSHSSAIHAE